MPGGIKKADEAGIIKKLIRRYNYESLTYQFRGDTRILYKRFTEREKTPERGAANTVGRAVFYEEFDSWCRNLDNFDIGGKKVRVDTTDFEAVDYESLLENGREFMRDCSTY